MGTVSREKSAIDRLSIWSTCTSANVAYNMNYQTNGMVPEQSSPSEYVASSNHYATPVDRKAKRTKHKFYVDHSCTEDPAYQYQSETPSWFFENTSRNSAEVILTRGKRYGNILVRQSATFTGNYVISARYDHGNSIEICHYEVEVERRSGGDVEFRLKVGPGKHPSQPSLTDLLIYFMKLNPGLVPMVTNNWETLGIKSPASDNYQLTNGNNSYMTTSIVIPNGVGNQQQDKDYELIRGNEPDADYEMDIQQHGSSSSSTSSKGKAQGRSHYSPPPSPSPVDPEPDEPLYMNDGVELLLKQESALQTPPSPPEPPPRPPKPNSAYTDVICTNHNSPTGKKQHSPPGNHQYSPTGKEQHSPLGRKHSPSRKKQHSPTCKQQSPLGNGNSRPVKSILKTKNCSKTTRQEADEAEEYCPSEASTHAEAVNNQAEITVQAAVEALQEDFKPNSTKNKKSASGMMNNKNSSSKNSSKGSVFSEGHFFEELTRKIKQKGYRSVREKDKQKDNNVTVIEISNPQLLTASLH